jgi:anti-sigma-K factor RskA
MMAGSDDLEALAGEYVLGTLSAEERLAVQQRLLDSPDLARLVAEWEDRLAPLAEDLPPVTPRPEVWRRLRRTIAGRQRTARPSPGWWNRIGLWRGWAAATTALAMGLAFVVLTAPPPLRLVAVLDDAQGRPLWVVRASAEDSRVLARALGDAGPAERVPELWLLPGGQAPVSLGVLDRAGPNLRTLPEAAQRLLAVGAGLAVSLEPPGGSPTGQPTGAIVSTGVLVADPA